MATKKTTTKKPEEVVSETPEVEKKTVKKTKKVTLDEYIDVQSCVAGRLFWKSPKTGYKIVWNEYGEINPMQVSDLIDMRNASKSFFIRNLVVLVGDRAKDIMEYLQITKYYTDIKTSEDIDEILLGDASEVTSALEMMNPTTREAAVVRARELYNEGKLDSAKTVAAIRRVTGFDISM